MKLIPILVLTALLGAAHATAQPEFALDAEAMDRQSIIFAPVMTADSSHGTRLPATVVGSPDSASALVARFPGTLEQWHVTPGTEIVAGQLLASIRSNELLQLQQEWLVLGSEVALAEQNRNRDQGLFDQGIISAQRLQQAVRSHEQLAIRHAALRQQLLSAGFNSQQLTALQGTQSADGVYPLSATIAGVLTRRAFNAGEFVPAFAPVATVLADASLWLNIQAPARVAAVLDTGHELQIEGRDFTLTLRQIERRVNADTQTVTLLAEFDAPVDYMAGQVVSVLIPPVASGVLVPASAVVHSGDLTSVYVRTANGFEVRDLALIPAGDAYLATSGIRAGESVAVRGTALLKGMQLGLGLDQGQDQGQGE
jgi:RND family efflux transporter MFP subunit